jgi:DNA repair protein RadC
LDSLKILDLPQNERPREKLLRYGAQTLSNSELLAVILRSGTAGENILNLCNRILKESNGLNGLLNVNQEQLLNIKGIKEGKATQLLAVAELSKRFRSYMSGEEIKITSPKDIAFYLMEDMRYLEQEELRVILLNTKNIVIGVKISTRGTINSSLVHPREVFKEAIRQNAASIIICHNHPSGDPAPSSEDINITNRLKECGKLVGIELVDHVIIGNGNYLSLKEKGIL